MSTVPETEIELYKELKPDVDMGTRAEIVARLRQLPEILNKTDGEIAEIIGITRQTWSNYKSETVDSTIRPIVALELWNAFGVPMEWIYDGQTARADPEMRSKLTIANRNAEAWLASRRPPRRNKAHIALIIGLGMALAWGWPSGAPRANHAPTSIVGDCGGVHDLPCPHIGP